MTAASRRFLGRDFSFSSFRRVYEIPDGLEVDEDTFTEIERTRVYFDDVLAITYHRYVGRVFMIVAGLLAAFFAALAVLIGIEAPAGGLVFFAVFGSPFLIAMAVRGTLGVDVITVYGRRTLARVRFGFRKARAREVFEGLAARIRARQEEVSNSLAPPAPPPPPDEAFPLPPVS